MEDGIKRTPLYGEHLLARAKMISFAGYCMPVQYAAGIVAEHKAVRHAVGLFDVSHMGEIELRGGRALDLVQYLTTNDASHLQVGQAQYSVLCQEDGCALDDILVYRFPDRYRLVVNAVNHDRDLEWVRKFAPNFDVEVTDLTGEVALMALQGPSAEEVLRRVSPLDPSALAYYHFTEGEVAGRHAVISRTGYTGEDGFELYVDADAAVPVWRGLLDNGQDLGIQPAGLGARDALRLEMGYILYGNDLDEEHTPLEAGLDWVVKLDKDNFLGRMALRRQRDEGPRQRLVGFTLTERGFPREGYEVRAGGESVGTVTSGIFSPTLDQGIGMAYVPSELAAPGTALEVVIRGRSHAARVTRTPFYEGGSIRR